MSSLDQIVNVTITQQTSSVPGPSFQIPLIIGPNAPWGDQVRAYSSAAGMLEDGYDETDAEYVYALELTEQDVVPALFYVGKRSAAVKQVNTLAVATLTSAHVYSITIDQVPVSYTAQIADAQQDVLNGLLAAIAAAFPTANPISGVVAGTGAGALLTLTSSVFGQGVAYTGVDSLLTLVQTVANHGIAQDLGLIIAENNSWYGIILCSNTDYDISQMAAAVEAITKVFIGVSSDSDIPTSVTTDLLSILKGKNYDRTGLVYTALSFNKGIEAAWIGGQLPQTPGSNNWAFNTLKGISPDILSENAQAVLIGVPEAQVKGKNGNIYQTVGGKDITQMGTMVSGQYIDITIGLDWLRSTIQFNLYNALTSAPKIPYTDKGTAVLISAVQAAIQQGVVNGLIDGDSPITVTAPVVLSVPQSQRANRVAPTISFTCRLQGAFNAVIVKGTVTV